VSAIRRIGLTGGIGSGKSTVAQELRELGAEVIDADQLAREVSAPHGPAIELLRKRFGARSIGADGGMDRAWMRALAFADPGARRALEAIVHPLVEQATQARVARAAPGAVIVFEVPLLVESGRWRTRVDRILVIDCDETTQVARVTQRPGWAADTARQVIQQQATRAARRSVADAVIDNTRLTRAELSAQVHALWAWWHPPQARPPV
jgi:dephospho-CoA kinase